jgi:hypothetical protein
MNKFCDLKKGVQQIYELELLQWWELIIIHYPEKSENFGQNGDSPYKNP